MFLGTHTKIHLGWAKFRLRKAVDGILPKEVQSREDKLGFAIPQDRWVTALESHIREQLAGKLACGDFGDRDKLQKRIRQGTLGGKTLW